MPLASGDNLTEAVLARCRGEGFAEVGIAGAAPIERADELLAWLAESKHGEMLYLERNTKLRIDPRQMLEGCQSIIVVADRYAGGESDSTTARQGRVARYARGDDYHHSMKKRLIKICDELQAEYPGERFRAAVDTAPVMERDHAARAGLGSVGKHTLLLEPSVGSYFFLGEILTTLALLPNENPAADHCGSCTRCLDACPTDALTPFSLDARRCISYLTIEHRSLIDEEFHAGIGDWIFGCDICQEVCPHNGDTSITQNAAVHPVYESRRSGFDLLEILNWTEADRREAFTKSALKRVKLPMFKRNALIAAGSYLRENADAELESCVRRLAENPEAEEVIRITAGQILRRLACDARGAIDD